MQDPNTFDNFLKPLKTETYRATIKEALLKKIESVDELRDVAVGSSKPELTTLFQRTLDLGELHASALAGLFFRPACTSIYTLIFF